MIILLNFKRFFHQSNGMEICLKMFESSVEEPMLHGCAALILQLIDGLGRIAADHFVELRGIQVFFSNFKLFYFRFSLLVLNMVHPVFSNALLVVWLLPRIRMQLRINKSTTQSENLYSYWLPPMPTWLYMLWALLQMCKRANLKQRFGDIKIN